MEAPEVGMLRPCLTSSTTLPALRCMARVEGMAASLQLESLTELDILRGQICEKCRLHSALRDQFRPFLMSQLCSGPDERLRLCRSN